MDDDDLADLLRAQTATGLSTSFYTANVVSSGFDEDDPFANPFANPFTGQASGSASVLAPRDAVASSFSEPEGYQPSPIAETTISANTNGFQADYQTSEYDNQIRDGGFQDLAIGLKSTELEYPILPMSPPKQTHTAIKYPVATMNRRIHQYPSIIKPTSDILGLLVDEDPLNSLKKAFVPKPEFVPTSTANEDSVKSPSVSTNPSTSHVYQPRSSNARKKIGISFDSVRKERELKEAEAKKATDDLTKRSTEKGPAEIQASSTQSVTEDADIDDSQHPGNRGLYTASATDSISASQGHGPIVPAIIAEQILTSFHPVESAGHVAQVISENTGMAFDRTQMPQLEKEHVDPISIPLPNSRTMSPLPEDNPTDAEQSAPGPSHHELADDVSIGIVPHTVSGLQQGNTVLETSLASLDTSSSILPVQSTISAGQALPANRYTSWGRAFEEMDSSQTPEQYASPVSVENAWTTSLPEPYRSTKMETNNGGSSAQWRPTHVDVEDDKETIEIAISSSTSRTTEHHRSPTKNRILTQPVFSITISDPTKVGDPVRGYIVYTVTTRTTSPHYKRGEFSALRRFSDFLWLLEAVSNNNPGVIVPPMPDKNAFGRFEEQFVETRRAALQRTLNKMANHPVLSLDPDLKLFLSSDAFSVDVKCRKQEMTQEKQGMLASIGGTIGGSRYVERDDWFDKQKLRLDSLEAHIRALSKSLELSSKQRLDLGHGYSILADTLASLGESDLSLVLSQVLHQFAELSSMERMVQEQQAKMDVVRLLNLADEHLRLIGSVRAAFASRIKSYFAWQLADADARRISVQSEKDRVKRGGQFSQTGVNPEIAHAERRANDAHADFDAVSRLVKLEFARFEQERVEDFKEALERYVDDAVETQRKMVEEWEAYHKELSSIINRHNST